MKKRLKKDEYNGFKRYCDEITKYPVLKADEVRKMIADYRKGGDQSIREAVIKANLRLVLKIANDYKGMGTPLEELVSYGNMGLNDAIDSYDTERGTAFTTWARFYIKARICRYGLDRGRSTVDTPAYCKMKAKGMEQVSTVSLDEPFDGDEDGRTIGECIADDGMNPAEQAERNDMVDAVRKAMADVLTPREKMVVELIFGYGGKDERTAASISDELGVTHQMVSIIKKSAMDKLKRVMEKRLA